MEIPSRSIRQLLARRKVACSSAMMHLLCPPSGRLLPSPRFWHPAPAQQHASLMAALSPPVRRLSRSPHGSRQMASNSGVKSEDLAKPDRRGLIPSARDHVQTKSDMISLGDKLNRSEIEEFIIRYGNVGPSDSEEDGMKASIDATDGKGDARSENVIPLCDDGLRKEDARVQNITKVDEEIGMGQSTSDDSCDEDYVTYHCGYDSDGVVLAGVLHNSRHRDGSIYMGNGWKSEFRIADRSETRLEPMMQTDPRDDCILYGQNCQRHSAGAYVQIFSLKMAKVPMDGASVEVYGYIAARDLLDSLLNYIVNISRDDAIIVEQGSLIEMTGPKRRIDLSEAVIIEYDMKIKTGECPKDDLQLIDGVVLIDELESSVLPFKNRIHGDCGAIDMTRMSLNGAAEATVEVVISEVQGSFHLSVSCFTSGIQEEIRFFDGVIGKSCSLRRYVVAVLLDTCMDLKFKVGPESYGFAEHCRSFKAASHGSAIQRIKIELASISVKYLVCWPGFLTRRCVRRPWGKARDIVAKQEGEVTDAVFARGIRIGDRGWEGGEVNGCRDGRIRQEETLSIRPISSCYSVDPNQL
ncbi:hypothetical protein ACP70R_009314 [Stipagrostis hirtigluma subsp. patula]